MIRNAEDDPVTKYVHLLDDALECVFEIKIKRDVVEEEGGVAACHGPCARAQTRRFGLEDIVGC